MVADTDLDATRKGAIGFDGDGELLTAHRGPQVHVKTRGTHDCER